jgi:molybdopterin-containing oxidoreductase family membrane subunit
VAEALLHEPLIGGNKTLHQVSEDVCAPLERRATGLWWAAFLAAFTLLLLGTVAVSYQIATGIGTWGLNSTIGWAFDITNFVFWIGIGHAGTLISAILFLFRQRWRTSVNRSAEAMTLFAVICAGLFPVIHMGRPWLAYWIAPYPNTRGSLWINFRSPLVWDFFAISTYFLISLVFWYVGLLPDLATVRDRERPGWHTRILAWFSLGWNGSARHWQRYELVYLILAGLATPLVISVHGLVSTDFATAVLPGWHTTIFPPYFVAGAIFSGLAMVLTLMLIARKVMHLEDYITARHVDVMARLVLATGSLVALAYAIEFFTALYSGNPYEQFAFLNRAAGPWAWAYWLMVGCNALVPQLLWFKRVRGNLAAVFAISILVNVGMWFERFVIIVTALSRDFLPSSWADYAPTLVEIATLLGSFGLFFTCFLLFCRVLPVIAMAEVKGVLGPATRPHAAPADEVSRNGASADASVSHQVGHRVLTATFDSEEELLHATELARTRGWRILDVYTPCAVHGLDRAMGLRPTRLGLVAFACGALGTALALWLQFWTSAVDWPLNVGGRPWNSLPAFVPVVFEMMVLFAGVGAVAALLLRCRLFPGKKAGVPLPAVTDDRFVLVLEEGAAFDPGAVGQLFRSCHAIVEEREESEACPCLSAR